MGHTVYVATVGSSIEPILRGFLYSSPDIVYLLHGRNPGLKEKDPDSVAHTAAEKIRELGLRRCHLLEINPFSLESVMTEIIKIWQNHLQDRIIANMTGGTNIMASACLLAGFTASAEVIYVRQIQEGETIPLNEQVIVLPTPRIPFNSLNKIQREILLFLLSETEAGATLLERANSIIASHMKLTPQTISHHLRSMERVGLIRKRKEGRILSVNLTPSGLLFARMLEEPRD
ncbi:MAG: DUF6293 family protein [Candidatus Thorarchaeota archaeon]